MKITKSQLKQIIKEELRNMQNALFKDTVDELYVKFKNHVRANFPRGIPQWRVEPEMERFYDASSRVFTGADHEEVAAMADELIDRLEADGLLGPWEDYGEYA